ncbi:MULTISPECIES: B12-binding domain-containing protein [unclassified Mycobacterium]|uniref:cobalamin B12-binding domain-containing protein n=1 Tax=unclassified Mycobacterium TaxID=2642494 RepID=UPI0007FDDBF8|nr:MULTISPECIES: cobalamin-dependent protein [unclassified Mycobacterium]OBG58879.1 cobalamin-binding protein [Mycobacterium sp. E188]OBG68328.1 cobalamin-binding protein [Mycobacterium sp. E735]OBH37256.1 cobalamin-binding protein [Mycobacterium sp. E183]
MTSYDTDMTSATGAADDLVVRERLWGALTDRDEYAAAATVFAAMEAGMTPEDVLLEVIAPVQHKVGAEWAANRISVAQEHAASAINDRVIAALAHHAAGKVSSHGGRVTLACVDGEWHALPARLLAEVLRLRGWQVDFLGAQVPTPHLVAHLHQHGPDVVALSCSIPTRLPNAHAAIVACQSAGFPVLAGGAAFGRDGRFARQLGADAWAPDARTADERLSRGLSPVRRASNRQPVDDLPHLADQEYTMVSRSAARLVKSTVADLEDRFPAMRAYSPLQHQRTVEDIAHIVDFLTVSLYTDDDALFTDFISWTAEILTARGVPAASLHPALDSLTVQLNEFPRGQRLLTAANDALTAIAGPGASE